VGTSSSEAELAHYRAVLKWHQRAVRSCRYRSLPFANGTRFQSGTPCVAVASCFAAVDLFCVRGRSPAAEVVTMRRNVLLVSADPSAPEPPLASAPPRK